MKPSFFGGQKRALRHGDFQRSRIGVSFTARVIPLTANDFPEPADSRDAIHEVEICNASLEGLTISIRCISWGEVWYPKGDRDEEGRSKLDFITFLEGINEETSRVASVSPQFRVSHLLNSRCAASIHTLEVLPGKSVANSTYFTAENAIYTRVGCSDFGASL